MAGSFMMVNNCWISAGASRPQMDPTVVSGMVPVAPDLGS